MKREDYLTIQAWMLDLGLTDKQLRLYAMIWGYSRYGRGVWRGSASDIAAWCGCSVRHAQRLVYELENRGLLRHEVLIWSNGKEGGTRSEFWAVEPGEAAAPEKGGKTRITWRGSRHQCRKGVTTPMSQGGNDADVVTPKAVSIYSQDRNIHKCGGGNKSARDRAKTTTITTGFLFENDELSGLTPGDSARVRLPWTGKPFREAWEMLLRQPSWQGKTPEALQIALDTLEMVCSPDEAVYIVRLAISKGWDSIKDPSRIIAKDADIIPRYPASTWEGADNE